MTAPERQTHITLLRAWIIEQQRHCRAEIALVEKFNKLGEMDTAEPEYPEYSAIQANMRRFGTKNNRWLEELTALLAHTLAPDDDDAFAEWRSRLVAIEEEIHAEMHEFLMADSQPHGHA
jgi:hypothetical protein